LNNMDKLQEEKKYLSMGKTLIAGVDEVGRGPLAGPVVCCAVIMPLGENDIIEGIDDSKKISEKKRVLLAEKIKEKAIAYCIKRIEPKEIDEINILNAVKKCMREAVLGLSVTPDVVLVDGNDIGVNIPCEYLVKGDARSYTIGAASILAKVYRDNLMEEYDGVYPEYNFKKHKGYGTKVHIDAIKEIGPCEIHRRSFIKNFWVDKAKDEPKSI